MVEALVLALEYQSVPLSLRRMDRVLVNKYGQVCCAECKHPHLDKCWHCGCPAYVAEEEARNRAIEHWNKIIRTGRTMGSDITKEEKRMAFELNEGQGSLFGNNKKTKDTQPDWKGSIKIGGKVYRIAGWTRQGKSGEPFYSLQVDKYDLPKSDGKDIDQALPAQDDEIRY